ncbi:MAG: histidinolphosphatase [Trizodia sp. TS-e1964]|nr:MAG: histidinolphosphatase [Trizodia sp. TS-e1964]
MPQPFPFPFGIGHDICKIHRIQHLISKSRGKNLAPFVSKIFNREEKVWFYRNYDTELQTRSALNNTPDVGPPSPALRVLSRFLAGRFAAKEAAMKAHQGPLSWHDITIVQPLRGTKPLCVIHPSHANTTAILASPSAAQSTEMENPSDSDATVKETFSSFPSTNEDSPLLSAMERDDGQVALISITHDGEYASAVVIVAERPVQKSDANSHSGQFCLHAKGSLEEMVQMAIFRKMCVFALTEHIPREQERDLYPEEIAASKTPSDLAQTFKDFYAEALRLKRLYAGKIDLLLGFEGEWIRPSSLAMINNLLTSHKFDLFVGSLHHVHEFPIDFDHITYGQAVQAAGGTEENLFGDYFDGQLEMLEALRPPVVGHFDLIRLKSENPELSMRKWEGVWDKVTRNLQFIVSYNGIMEVNSASLRKGMKEPYPNLEICKAFREIGGKFTLSDDSHSTDQIGLNYAVALSILELANVTSLEIFETGEGGSDKRFSNARTRTVPISDLKSYDFWNI